MRKIVHFLFLLAAFYSQAANGQTTAAQPIVSGSTWEADKKAVLADLMQFDDKEADAFWPLYESYMKDWCKLMNHRLYRIIRYCDDLLKLTPETSHIADDLFANDVDLGKLQKKTYKKVRKVLSATRATQFMQLEYSLQVSLLSEMQQRVMTVGDLVKKL